MALSVVEEELGARDAMTQVLIERGFSGFTIPFVEAAFFTGGDYFAEVTQYAPASVICTPRFNVPEGDDEFFKSLIDLYHYNVPFNPSLVPFMYADWWKEATDRGGFKRAKGGAYLLSDEAKPLGGRLCRTFAAALYSSRTRKEVIIDRRKGKYVRGEGALYCLLSDTASPS